MTRGGIGSTTCLVIAIAAWCCVPASAECIRTADDSPRTRMMTASVVFVADVQSVEAVDRPPTFRYRTRFKVIKDFKGQSVAEHRVLDVKANSTEFRFEKGQRVLVYAYGPVSDASTGCGATRLIELDDPELGALERIASELPVRP